VLTDQTTGIPCESAVYLLSVCIAAGANQSKRSAPTSALSGIASRGQLTLASGAIPSGAGLTSNGLLDLSRCPPVVLP
jgi:hypothetical protein